MTFLLLLLLLLLPDKGKEMKREGYSTMLGAGDYLKGKFPSADVSSGSYSR